MKQNTKELLKITAKLIALYLGMIALSYTCSGQTTLNDSLTCFKPTQIKQIITDIKKGALCDSMLTIRDSQIFLYRKQSTADTKTIGDLNAANEVRFNENIMLSEDLFKYKKRAKNNLLLGGAIGGIIVVALQTFLSK